MNKLMYVMKKNEKREVLPTTVHYS